MQNYKELRVWLRAHQFTLGVYNATKAFPEEEMFGLTSQLRRAAASIAANIAEGSGRGTQGDFAKFLQIALGSANESEYLLLLSNDLQYMQQPEFEVLQKEVNEVKGMLITLIRKVSSANQNPSPSTPKPKT